MSAISKSCPAHRTRKGPRQVQWVLPGRLLRTSMIAAVLFLVATPGAFAGKASWLDDLIKQVVRDAGREGKSAVRTGEKSFAKSSARLFANGADEGLETIAKRFDSFASAGKKLEQPAEALLDARFAAGQRRARAGQNIWQAWPGRTPHGRRDG